MAAGCVGTAPTYLGKVSTPYITRKSRGTYLGALGTSVLVSTNSRYLGTWAPTQVGR